MPPSMLTKRTKETQNQLSDSLLSVLSNGDLQLAPRLGGRRESVKLALQVKHLAQGRPPIVGSSLSHLLLERAHELVPLVRPWRQLCVVGLSVIPKRRGGGEIVLV